MEDLLAEIPWGIILPILLIQFVLMLVALVSCIRARETNGPKWLWIVLILFANLLGPILYFVVGRREG